MRLGHLGKGREGVYGLGSLWRVVWCMEIGVIGVGDALLLVENEKGIIEMRR